MTSSQRFYVSFLTGPTKIGHLGIAWLNLFFSLLFFWITYTYFQNPFVTELFMGFIIFSILTLLYKALKQVSYRYQNLSLGLVLMNILLLIVNLDFMGLLIFLSGFHIEKEITMSNPNFLSFSIIIFAIFVISLSFFF